MTIPPFIESNGGLPYRQGCSDDHHWEQDDKKASLAMRSFPDRGPDVSASNPVRSMLTTSYSGVLGLYSPGCLLRLDILAFLNAQSIHRPKSGAKLFVSLCPSLNKFQINEWKSNSRVTLEVRTEYFLEKPRTRVIFVACSPSMGKR